MLTFALYAGPVLDGLRRTLFFVPPADGDAVDSRVLEIFMVLAQNIIEREADLVHHWSEPRRVAHVAPVFTRRASDGRPACM